MNAAPTSKPWFARHAADMEGRVWSRLAHAAFVDCDGSEGEQSVVVPHTSEGDGS